MRVDLFNQIKEKGKDISIKDFKDSLIDLFDEMIKQSIDKKDKEKIARIRAYVDIKFKDL